MNIERSIMENESLIERYQRKAKDLFLQMNTDMAPFWGKLFFSHGFNGNQNDIYLEEVVEENMGKSKLISFKSTVTLPSEVVSLRILLKNCGEGKAIFQLRLPSYCALKTKLVSMDALFLGRLKQDILTILEDYSFVSGGIGIFGHSKKNIDDKLENQMRQMISAHERPDMPLDFRPVVSSYETFVVIPNDLNGVNFEGNVKLADGRIGTMHCKISDDILFFSFLQDSGSCSFLTKREKAIAKNILKDATWFSPEPGLIQGMLENHALMKNEISIIEAFLSETWKNVRVKAGTIFYDGRQHPVTIINLEN